MSHIPSHTACTVVRIEPWHDPNDGRNIINDNFECINETLGYLQVSSATGTTYLAQGNNINLGLTFSGSIPIYDVAVVDNPAFTSVSASTITATTIYSGSTNVGDLLTAITSSVLYTNATATPVTIGGIAAGSTFNNKTMTEMWDALLYPYQYPAFTSFSRGNLSATYELGETITIGSQTFTWATSNSSNVSANTISIVQNFSPVTTLLSNSANDGTQNITLSDTYSAGTSTTTTLYTITGYNSLGGTFSTTISISWRPRIYYGTSSSTTLNEAGIEALTSNALASGFVGTYSFAAGNYKYFCYPVSFGTATTFKDSSTNLDIAMEAVYTVSVTNAYGVTQNYNVHRTTNILGSSISIIIS